MGQLIVLGYPDAAEAEEVRRELVGLQQDHLIALEDAVVVVHHSEGKVELRQALKAFEQATTIKPSFWEALNNQALVLFEMGNTGEAIRRWRSVLEIKRNAEPMLALAAALNKQSPGDEESIDLARQALAEDPNYVLPGHQENQLWGKKLRQATGVLLSEPDLKGAVERAEANADPKSAE